MESLDVIEYVDPGLVRQHEEFVYIYRGKPLFQISNTSRQRAHKEVGLPHLRMHDLKHTFGRRLHAAGVPNETRKMLLGHRNGDITTHYSAPELDELIEAANKVCKTKSGKSPALVILKQRMA